MQANAEFRQKARSVLIRVGGGALLAAFAIHIIANLVLKEFPPPDPTLSELRTYLEAEADTWKVVHGLRYLAVAGLALFLGAAIVRVRSNDDDLSGGWEYVGLLGGSLLLANLFITNGIETFTFLDFQLQSEQPALFWLVFQMTRVLFTAEIAAWAILLFGFSMAGWLSATMPRLICALGVFAAVLDLLSGAFVGAMMTTGGWVEFVFGIAATSSLLWFVCFGGWMLWRGDT